MNRSHFALFVALLIHILLMLLFWILGMYAPDMDTKEKKEPNKIKLSLKELPEKFKKSGEKKVIDKKPTPIAPPMPKGSQLKEIVEQKKEPIEYMPQKQFVQKKPPINIPDKSSELDTKTAKKPIKEPETQPRFEPLPPQKPYIPLDIPALTPKVQQQPASKKEEKKSMNWLYEDKSAEDAKEEVKQQSGSSSIGNQSLKELYGDEFGKLTPGQQKYLLDNQEIMRRITQEVLNRVAQVNLTRDLNVNRTNVVEFYLHPNGDISDFKFLKKSGYYILDDTTKETIEYAYSRYPRPDEKILVRYNVFYNLARY